MAGSGFWDFVEGNLSGRRAATLEGNHALRQQAADYNGAIGEWKEHSNKLKLKLRDAEDNTLLEQARAEGLRAYVARLQEELARFAPQSELVRRKDEMAKVIQDVAAANFFAKHGWVFDMQTRTVTKAKKES